MYKDKVKQRESNRQAARRYRARRKGMTPTITPDIGMEPEEAPPVIPVQHDNPMRVGYEPLR